MTAAEITTAPTLNDRLARMLGAFLEGRGEDTRRCYGESLDRFGQFLGLPSAAEGTASLLQRGHGEANLAVLEWREQLRAAGLAPASVNRHLSAVRSVVKLARMIGIVSWAIEVPALKARAYRDTRGPGAEGFRALLEHLGQRTDRKAVRDQAVIRLMYERGLRSVEVRRLDVVDVDLKQNRVNVLGKARTEKEWLTLAPATSDAIAAWLRVRGPGPGPLFIRVHLGRGGAGRLTRQGLYRIVRKLGEAADVRARPHGLRHAAITAALDKGLDVRTVQRFSRHLDLKTLLLYDDNRTDLAGDVARAIAEPPTRRRLRRSANVRPAQ